MKNEAADAKTFAGPACAHWFGFESIRLRCLIINLLGEAWAPKDDWQNARMGALNQVSRGESLRVS